MNPQKKKIMFLGGGLILVVVAIVIFVMMQEPEPSPSPTQTVAAPTAAPTLPPLPSGKYVLSDVPCSENPEKHHITRELNNAECEQAFQQFTSDPFKVLRESSPSNPVGNIDSMNTKPSGCSYCDRETGCGSPPEPYTQKGIVYYNMNENVPTTDVKSGNKYVCFDKSKPEEAALPEKPIASELQALYDAANERSAQLLAEQEQQALQLRRMNSIVPVTTEVDENAWGTKMEGDTLINNVPTSSFYSSLYGDYTDSITTLNSLTGDNKLIPAGDGYLGTCGEGKELSKYQCEGNSNNSVGKCYTNPDKVSGSCGNSNLCEHTEETNPATLINNTATVTVYNIDPIKDELLAKTKRIKVMGIMSSAPFLKLGAYTVGSEQLEEIGINQNFNYNVKHSNIIKTSQEEWNQMKNIFNNAGQAIPDTVNMECPSFGDLITTDIMCNIGRKEVEMMFRLYKLQMDLDGLFSEGAINKVNGKYRHALNGGSTGQTIPKENQWEWLDAYLLYKEYSTPDGELWQGTKHHSSNVLSLNKVNWGEDSGQRINSCGSNYALTHGIALTDQDCNPLNYPDGYQAKGNNRNRLVDYGLPDVWHINQRDTRYLLGGHDKASYHKTTKLRHLLHGKHQDDTCGLGFAGLIRKKGEEIYNGYKNKFTLFSDGFVKDFVMDKDSDNSRFTIGNENYDDANVRADPDGLISREHNGADVYDNWKEINRFSDRYSKETLGELKYNMSPIFPAIKYKCCDQVSKGGAVGDIKIYDNEYKNLLISKDESEILLNPIHWGGVGFRVAGEPTYDLTSTIKQPGPESRGLRDNLEYNDDIQRILPFDKNESNTTRMKGVLEAVATLLQGDKKWIVNEAQDGPPTGSWEPAVELSDWEDLEDSEKVALARLYIWKVILSIDENTSLPDKDIVIAINDGTKNPGSGFYPLNVGNFNKLEKGTDQGVNPSPLLNDANLNILYPFGLGLIDTNVKWEESGAEKTLGIEGGIMMGYDLQEQAYAFDDETLSVNIPKWVHGDKAWALILEKAGMSTTEAESLVVNLMGNKSPSEIKEKLWEVLKNTGPVPKTCAYSELSFIHDPSLPDYKDVSLNENRMIQLPDDMVSNEYELPAADATATSTTSFSEDYNLDGTNNELMRSKAVWATSMSRNQKSVYGFYTLILEPLEYEWGDGYLEEEKSRHSISRENGGLILQKRFGKVLNTTDFEEDNIREYLNSIGVTRADDSNNNFTLEKICNSLNGNGLKCAATPGCLWNATGTTPNKCQPIDSSDKNMIGIFNNSWSSGEPNTKTTYTELSNTESNNINSGVGTHKSNKLYAQQCNYVRGGIEDNTCESTTDETTCESSDNCKWISGAYSNDYPWAAPPGCWEVDGKNYKVGGELLDDNYISEPWLIDYYNDTQIKSDIELGRNLISDGSIYPFNKALSKEYGQASHPGWDTNKSFEGTQYSNSVICAPKQYHDLDGNSLLAMMREKNKGLGILSNDDNCWRKSPSQCVEKTMNKSATLIPSKINRCDANDSLCLNNMRVPYGEKIPASVSEINAGGVCYDNNGVKLEQQVPKEQCNSPNYWYPVTMSKKETYMNPQCELREIKPIKRVCKKSDILAPGETQGTTTP